MSPRVLSKKIGDSNLTLIKDGLTINLLCEQAEHGFHWAKEFFGSLMDVHVGIL